MIFEIGKQNWLMGYHKQCLKIHFTLQHDYRVAIRTEGMIEDLVAHLRVQNEELQMHCAATIFKVCWSLIVTGLIKALN